MLTVDEVAGWPGAVGAGGAAGPGYWAYVADRGDRRPRRTDTVEEVGTGRAHDAATCRLAQEADHADEIARVLAAFADTAAAAGTELAAGRDDMVMRLVGEQSGIRSDGRDRAIDTSEDRRTGREGAGSPCRP